MKLMPESLLKIMFLLLMQWEAWAMNKDLLRVMHKFTCNWSIGQLVNQNGLRVMAQFSNH